MHRCASQFLLFAALVSASTLTGCLGKSSSNPGNGGVATVALNPSGSVSIDVGSTLAFTATGKTSAGVNVPNVNIQYLITVPVGSTAAAPLSIASNGNGCAGTWNAGSFTCSPGTPGIAIVNAIINGVSSAPTTVYVHQHIDSIQVSRLDPQGPPLYNCFSQGQSWNYAATAYSGTSDITGSVGPLTWSSTNTGVVTATPIVIGQPPAQSFNEVQVTAKSPGITQLFASASGTYSAPFSFTTCLVAAIYLQIGGEGQNGNEITVNTGGSIPVTATAVDTLYPFTGVPIPHPPLTWSTSNPEVALFSTTTNTTGTNSATARANVGGASLTVSCAPPSCNIGVLPGLPIYASDGLLPNKTKGFRAISVDVTPATAVPTYSAWAATTGCQDVAGCSSSLFSLGPKSNGKNPIAAIYTLPRTPNSLVFNHQSSARLYMGSKEGLMYIDVSGTNPQVGVVSSAQIPCNVSLCGSVLTVSNDGKLAVISDTVSNPHQVYIYNGSSNTAPTVDLVLSNSGELATAAAFSPDQLKLFILTNLGNLYVYSTVDAFTPVGISSTATDVKFSLDGSFAYVAGTPGATSISGFATCDTPTTEVLSGVTTSAPALALYPLPTRQLDSQGNWADVMLALDPPNIDMFGINVAETSLTDNEFVCNPPSVSLDTNLFPPPAPPVKSINLGQGPFVPLYAQLVANGSQMIIVAQNVPAVLVFNVSNGTTSAIPLNKISDPPLPFAASASTDGSQVYVAACDQYQNNDPTTCTLGEVHIVNTISLGDIQDVPYINVGDQNNNNMCNGLGVNAPLCVPNLIAIRPQ